MASGGGAPSDDVKCMGYKCDNMVSGTTELKNDDGPLCFKCFEADATEYITFIDKGDWLDGIPYNGVPSLTCSKITETMLNELMDSLDLGDTEVSFKCQVPQENLFVLKKEQLNYLIKLVPEDLKAKFIEVAHIDPNYFHLCDTCGEIVARHLAFKHPFRTQYKCCECKPSPESPESSQSASQ
jgi:hypothetical protein